MGKKDIENILGKTALVCDQMISFGGAERELLSILKLLPNSDIFTIVFNKKAFPTITQKVHTSFVQKLFPFKFSRHLKVLTPIAYESFDLRDYKTVISVSAGPAKGVIPSLDSKHIAMVMTPPRSLWDMELNVRSSPFRKIYRPISNLLNTFMRMWDVSISKRVDYWVSNSNYVKKKVEKRYHVECNTIYPAISHDAFLKDYSSDMGEDGEYFLVVSRLYDYKHVDIAISACIKAKKKLLIIGEGPDIKYLKKVAKGNKDIKFLGFLKDDMQVRAYYSKAQALLFCGIEDFGLVPIEAMAQGTPVVAFNQGGVLETVVQGVTGEFFKGEEDLVDILKVFVKSGYNAGKVIEQARKFNEEQFLQNLETYLRNIYEH